MATSIFIVGPIGEKNSDIRKSADELRDHIVFPAAEAVFGSGGFEISRADEIGEPGRITLQILQRLVASDVTVVDLSALNPNVMYELGIRQAMRKPYVILRPSSLTLPFDVRDFRAVDYELSLSGAQEAVKNLKTHLRAATTKERSPVDDLLFGVVGQEGDAATSAVERLLPQLLDQMSEIRQGIETLTGGVYHLMQREDRERQDQQEFRQQEFGLRMLQAFVENPDGLEKAMELANKINTPNQPTPAPLDHLVGEAVPNRATRRAQGKKAKTT